MTSQTSCPAWCTADHSGPSAAPGAHSSSIASVPVGGPGDLRERASVEVHVFTGSAIPDPLVSLTAILRQPEWQWFATFTRPEHAWNLAKMLELLADASPEQHRDLAAAIRETLRLIQGEDQC